jgi:putative photosynthetic complex assembly protein 2
VVSWSGHIVPFIVTVAIWFIATGLIAWADNRERATFSTSLMVGSIAGITGLLVILVASLSTSVWAVYLAFIGALMVWGWHELSVVARAIPRSPASPASGRLRRR